MRTTHDDLEFLRSANYLAPSPTDARLASSILRRLLHDRMLPLAWAAAGLDGEPQIEATDLAAMLGAVPPQYIEYAYAGGAATVGASHTGYVLLRVPAAEVKTDEVEETVRRMQAAFGPMKRRMYSLSEFSASPSVVSGLASVSRVEVVRYVANKLGGVHWDAERGGWTQYTASRHRLLDEEHIRVGRLSAPLYEVVSIAQAVGCSDDAGRLIERIDHLAPDDEFDANVLRFREGRIGAYADLTFNPNAESA